MWPFNSSLKIGTKNSAISLGEVIFLSIDHLVCDCILLPISNAANRLIALSSPIPEIFFSSDKDKETNPAKFKCLFTNSWDMVITDFPFLPVLRIIATNSASVRLPAPNFLSFSRGLSSAGSSLTVKIFTSELII